MSKSVLCSTGFVVVVVTAVFWGGALSRFAGVVDAVSFRRTVAVVVHCCVLRAGIYLYLGELRVAAVVVPDAVAACHIHDHSTTNQPTATELDGRVQELADVGRSIFDKQPRKPTRWFERLQPCDRWQHQTQIDVLPNRSVE